MTGDPVTAGGLATAVGWTLLHSLWQAAILWLAVASFRRRVSDPTLRSRAADIGLLLFLLGQSSTFALCLSHDDGLATTFASSAAIEIDKVGLIKKQLPPTTGWAGRAIAALDPCMPWIVACWSAWSLLRLTLYLRGVRWATRTLSLAPSLPGPLLAACESVAKKLGVSRAVRFVAIAITESPGTIGWLRPYVFIPPAILASLTPFELEAIVTHELAHVLRRDYASSALRLVVESIYTANPFVAWIVRQANQEAEKSCDAIATRSLGEPTAYVRALATLADRVVSSRTSVHATGGSLTDRVMTVLKPPMPTRGRTVWARAAGVTTLAIALLTLMSATVVAAAEREREISSLENRSLGESVLKILDLNRGATSSTQSVAHDGTVESLLGLARDAGEWSASMALMRRLDDPFTYQSAAISVHQREQLVRASAFEAERIRALLSTVLDRPEELVNPTAFRKFMRTLAIEPLAQPTVGLELRRPGRETLRDRVMSAVRVDRTYRLQTLLIAISTSGDGEPIMMDVNQKDPLQPHVTLRHRVAK